MFSHLNDTATLITVVAAASVALAGAGKWLVGTKRNPGVFRRGHRDVRALRDTILGRDPVLDTITGHELSPAIPGLGARMADQDERLDRLTTVVETLADVHVRVDALEVRVVAIEQNRDLERIVGKVESVQLMKTMETAINAEPPDEG